jgi:hypothetical protein
MLSAATKLACDISHVIFITFEIKSHADLSVKIKMLNFENIDINQSNGSGH